jgi:DNA-binding NtrC family response regulator
MSSTVLLVAEDPFFLQNLSGNLKQLRALVVTAESNHEALEVCANHEVDLALLDIRQQGREAMQVLARLKKNQPETEVILLSGPDNIAVAIEGMQQGAYDDIPIPCDRETLLQKVKSALKRKKARVCASRKRSLLNVFEDTMVAAAYAQAGEFDTAQKIHTEGCINSFRKKRSESDK